jgi:transposase
LENVFMAQGRLSEAAKKRLKAGRMLLAGKGCAEVAQTVGVARQTVYTWKRLLDEGGIDVLRAVPERGRPAQLDGLIQVAFLPPYAPDPNPVEYLWAWLKRHALANYCPNDLSELHTTARHKLKSAQKRPSIVAACWMQATLW